VNRCDQQKWFATPRPSHVPNHEGRRPNSR
jgi:hypothetical protein